MSSLIPALLDLVLSILETCFAAPPKTAVEDDSSHDKVHQSEKQKAAALKAAFDFFELTPEKATRDSASKAFRRLSLLHHPDRNRQSEESKQMMQKLNNYYNLITEELDRREGVLHEDDFQVDDEPAPEQHRKRTSKRCERQAQNRARWNEEEEMRKERDEIRRQKKQVRQSKKRSLKKINQTVKSHYLNTQQGRDQAYQKWQEAVHTMEQFSREKVRTDECREKARMEPTREADTCRSDLDDIDDVDVHVAEPNVPSFEPEAIPVKPVNLVMECCTEDIVVALRMGLSDVVFDTLQENIEKIMEAMFAKCKELSESKLISAVSIYFVSPLDDDGNTLLHYAVYYESLEVIGAIYYLSISFHALQHVFLKENLRGMIPLDFCNCCVKDSSIPDRMKLFTEAAREKVESKQLWPSLKKSGRRLWGIVRNVNFASATRLVNLVTSYLIGTRLFGVSRITSILILAWTQLEDLQDPLHQFGYASSLFGWQMAWCWIRYVLSIIPRLLYFLTIPLLIYVFFAKSGPSLFSERSSKGKLIFTLVFLPIGLLHSSLDYVEYRIKLPRVIKKGSELERSSCMLIFSLGCLFIKYCIAWYRAPTNDEIASVTDDAFSQGL